MRFGKFFGLAVLCLAMGVAAQAQVGIFGTFTGQRFGGITCPSIASPCANNDGRIQPYGGDFGAYYDFKTYGPVRVGATARGEVLDTNKRGDSSSGAAGAVRQYEVMGGVRASFRTRYTWLHPYAEVLGGYVRNNANGLYTNTVTTNNTVSPPTTVSQLSFNPALYKDYPAVKGVAGLDIRLLPILDLRLVELGIGEAFGSATTLVQTTNTTSGSGTSSATRTISSSSSSHGLQTIGAGIVIHFP